MIEKNVSMIGGVSAGKTTFLIALWHVVSDMHKPHKVKLRTLPAIRDRLNELEEFWLQCNPIPRTPLSSSNDIVVGEISVDEDSPLILCIPDRAGESFHHQWAFREVTADYAEAIRRANGVLLFINPERLKRPRTIDAAVQEIADIAGIVGAPSRPRPREASDAPDQVVLVELLQFVEELRAPSRPPKLAVMISAWDLVEHEGLTPRQWLEAWAPLLAQFVDANKMKWSTEVFGVSAFGGDPSREKQRLLDVDLPADRPYVIDGNGARLEDFTLAVGSVLQ
jgi:hypothetical protein